MRSLTLVHPSPLLHPHPCCTLTDCCTLTNCCTLNAAPRCCTLTAAPPSPLLLPHRCCTLTAAAPSPLLLLHPCSSFTTRLALLSNYHAAPCYWHDSLLVHLHLTAAPPSLAAASRRYCHCSLLLPSHHCYCCPVAIATTAALSHSLHTHHCFSGCSLCAMLLTGHSSID